MHVVEMEGVSKNFGPVTAVDNLSLSVPPGCVYGFIGPNGSGKTTTLRMIMSIFYPDAGQIRVFGSERRQSVTDRIGYLPEERGLYRKMRVRALLRFYGSLKNGSELNRDVDLWLEKLHMTDWANKKQIQILDGQGGKPRVFNLRDIQSGKKDDPLLVGGEIIVIKRRFF